MINKQLILSIDAGSSSIRCTAYEHVGLQQRGGRDENPIAPHTGNQEGDGAAVDPSLSPVVRPLENVSYTIQMASVIPNSGYIKIHDVLDGIDECVDEVLQLLRSKLADESYEVIAIGFSTFVMNLIGVDESGGPLGESATLSYACNREDVVRECQKLRVSLGEEKVKRIYQQTGAPIHPAYALPQLLAFYRDSNNSKRVHRWQTISSICIHRWTGGKQINMPISFSEASWTGMMNFRTCAWNEEIMRLLQSCVNLDNASQVMPGLVDFDGKVTTTTVGSFNDVATTLRNGIPKICADQSNNPYWERWPELQKCKFFLGIGDGAAANIGSKCGVTSITEPRIAVTIGTSAAARVCLNFPITNQSVEKGVEVAGGGIEVPSGLFCYRVDRNRLLLGGALTDGGSVVEWARSLLNLHSKESFDECMEKVSDMYKSNCLSKKTTNSLSMIPFLSGERSTGFRGGARACMSGMTRETTSTHFMYACLEGVILRLGAVLKLISGVCNGMQSLADIPFSISEKTVKSVLIASGNALERNSLWRQMLADCSGLCVLVDGDSSEGTSRGVALLLAGSSTDKCAEEIAENLVILNSARPNDCAKELWNQASTSQNYLIEAISPTWGNAALSGPN